MTFLPSFFDSTKKNFIRSRMPDSRRKDWTRIVVLSLARYLGLESIRALPMMRLLGIGLMMIRSRVGGIGGSWVYIVGHLAREKRARWLGSAAPYTDYLLIYHAAGGHHLTFAIQICKRNNFTRIGCRPVPESFICYQLAGTSKFRSHDSSGRNVPLTIKILTCLEKRNARLTYASDIRHRNHDTRNKCNC